MEQGIKAWADAAARITQNAASTKDWRLTRKADRRFKEVAIELSKRHGYIIATPQELAQAYPDLFDASHTTSRKKFIWAVSYYSFRPQNKMCFMPLR